MTTDNLTKEWDERFREKFPHFTGLEISVMDIPQQIAAKNHNSKLYLLEAFMHERDAAMFEAGFKLAEDKKFQDDRAQKAYSGGFAAALKRVRDRMPNSKYTSFDVGYRLSFVENMQKAHDETRADVLAAIDTIEQERGITS